MTTDWPYDAPQDDPLTALRIPVAHARAGYTYLVTFDVESGERPTDAEAAIIASYIEFERTNRFNPAYAAKLLERPFDIDAGNNTLTLHKYGKDSWGHRRDTWEIGPWLVPPWNTEYPHTLVRVLDQQWSPGGRLNDAWQQWKTDRPDLFPEATS